MRAMTARRPLALCFGMLWSCTGARGPHDVAVHDDLEAVREQSDLRQSNHARELPPEPPPADGPGPRASLPPREIVRIGARRPDSPRVDDPGPRPVLKVVGGRHGNDSVEKRNIDDDEDGAGETVASPQELALYKKGNDAERASKHKDALEAFGKLLVLRPDGPLAEQAMLGRAVAHQGDGDSIRAAEDLESLVNRFPTSDSTPEVLFRLVGLHRGLGHRERAAELSDRLSSQYPKSEAARRLAREKTR